MTEEQSQRLEDEIERAKRQRDYQTLRALMRVKYSTIYGPKETWRPKLKEDWND